MMSHRVFLLMLIVGAMYLARASAGGGSECFSMWDCECGESCVTEQSRRCGFDDIGCTCKPGCTVFDVFIAPGTSEHVYGNSCHCPHSVDHMTDSNKGRLTACSRAAWWGAPQDMYPYERNARCVY